MAAIIRSVMPEFGADGPGFAIHDPEVNTMCAAYNAARRCYFVVTLENEVCGGGGIAPLDGAADDVCELRKMYFLPKLRGLGAGGELIDRCLQAARDFGFTKCYLETLTGMERAQRLYLKHGFGRLEKAMGDTGHFGCNRFYLKPLG
jgi:putative acetyltransferase